MELEIKQLRLLREKMEQDISQFVLAKAIEYSEATGLLPNKVSIHYDIQPQEDGSSNVNVKTDAEVRI